MIAVTFLNYEWLNHTIQRPQNCNYGNVDSIAELSLKFVYNLDFTYRSEVQTFLLKAAFKNAY